MANKTLYVHIVPTQYLTSLFSQTSLLTKLGVPNDMIIYNYFNMAGKYRLAKFTKKPRNR